MTLLGVVGVKDLASPPQSGSIHSVSWGRTRASCGVGRSCEAAGLRDREARPTHDGDRTGERGNNGVGPATDAAAPWGAASGKKDTTLPRGANWGLELSGAAASEAAAAGRGGTNGKKEVTLPLGGVKLGRKVVTATVRPASGRWRGVVPAELPAAALVGPSSTPERKRLVRGGR